jgi:sec-independent protein translocase protein TatB
LRKVSIEQVLALILDSLGSTELLFILVIALMFFGPRRLPQLSRTIGKSLAEFRKASEDFKRTWEREVALESAREPASADNTSVTEDPSRIDQDASVIQEPTVAPIPAEHVLSRQPVSKLQEFSAGEINSPDTSTDVPHSEPAPKREWL